MIDVGARELIGLEAAIAELGTLYLAAKEFAALRAAADEDLRLGSERLAAELRAHVRHGTLDAAVVDRTAARVAALRAHWRQTLEELRSSAPYREACAAWREGDSKLLRERLPRLLAGVRAIEAPRQLFFDVTLSSRRRGGTSPFLSAEKCAERIRGWREEGIDVGGRAADGGPGDLAYLQLVDDADLLESAVGLCWQGAALSAALFADGDDDHTCRFYGARLRAPFSVVVRAESDDAWWQASEAPYEEFRDELADRLRAAGLSVDVVD